MFFMVFVIGNISLMKFLERDFGVCMMLMELVKEVGFSDGVVNVIYGRYDCKIGYYDKIGIWYRKKNMF